MTTVGDNTLFAVAIVQLQVLATVLIESVAGDTTVTGMVNVAEDVLTGVCQFGPYSKS